MESRDSNSSENMIDLLCVGTAVVGESRIIV